MIVDIRKIYTYFKKRWPIKRSTNGFYNLDCPFGCIGSAGKHKFCVSFERQQVKCWRCPYKCSVTEFVQDFEAVDYKNAGRIINTEESIGFIDAEVLLSVRAIAQSEVMLPLGFTSILDGQGVMSDRARNYLLGRGFDLNKLDRKGFGYSFTHDPKYQDDFFGYIIMPFKRVGMLRYYIGRDFMGQGLRYKNPPTEKFGIGKADLVYNEDALSTHDEIFIFEGLWDAETMGDSAISTQGWSLSPMQRSTIIRARPARLVFCTDKKTEDNAKLDPYPTAVKTAMGFLDMVPEVFVVNADNIPGKGKDCNDLGREAFLNEYSKTKALTLRSALEAVM